MVRLRPSERARREGTMILAQSGMMSKRRAVSASPLSAVLSVGCIADIPIFRLYPTHHACTQLPDLVIPER
eukprot:2196582-Prymnesium_polylepis.1